MLSNIHFVMYPYSREFLCKRESNVNDHFSTYWVRFSVILCFSRWLAAWTMKTHIWGLLCIIGMAMTQQRGHLETLCGHRDEQWVIAVHNSFMISVISLQKRVLKSTLKKYSGKLYSVFGHTQKQSWEQNPDSYWGFLLVVLAPCVLHFNRICEHSLHAPWLSDYRSQAFIVN